MVRAKFFVDSVTYRADVAEVVLRPVTKTSEENEKFFKWTPGGEIKLQVVSKDTAQQFEPGKSYYIDFTLATE